MHISVLGSVGALRVRFAVKFALLSLHLSDTDTDTDIDRARARHRRIRTQTNYQRPRRVGVLKRKNSAWTLDSLWRLS